MRKYQYLSLFLAMRLYERLGRAFECDGDHQAVRLGLKEDEE